MEIYGRGLCTLNTTVFHKVLSCCSKAEVSSCLTVGYSPPTFSLRVCPAGRERKGTVFQLGGEVGRLKLSRAPGSHQNTSSSRLTNPAVLQEQERLLLRLLLFGQVAHRILPRNLSFSPCFYLTLYPTSSFSFGPCCEAEAGQLVVLRKGGIMGCCWGTVAACLF